MEDSLHIAEPVALVRPRGAHRFEAFSPKLKRRLTFYRRCAFDQWVLIESDPAIGHFCERPGFIQFKKWMICKRGCVDDARVNSKALALN